MSHYLIPALLGVFIYEGLKWILEGYAFWGWLRWALGVLVVLFIAVDLARRRSHTP